MKHDTAGDPMSGIKWTRRTTSNISEQLATLGIAASKNTVGRLLKQMDFRLRVNRKQIASTKNPDRNQQFYCRHCRFVGFIAIRVLCRASRWAGWVRNQFCASKWVPGTTSQE